MSNIIEVKDLVKTYNKGINAVDHLSFSVEEGSFFAFLGPNGAGKSTTINIISTLAKKTSGEVSINGFILGKDNIKIRENIGIVFQDSRLDGLLTVEENLLARGAFYGMNKKEIRKRMQTIDSFLPFLNLSNRVYGKISGGERRKVDIARALIHYPKILFLDEPTTSLDPKIRIQVWDSLKRIKEEQGVTIFLTTHYMEEVALADNVVIIDQGKIIAQGTPMELKTKYSSDVLKIAPKEKELFIQYLQKNKLTYSFESDLVLVNVKNSKEALAILNDTEELVETFEVLKGNMDDVFLKITGKKIDENDFGGN